MREIDYNRWKSEKKARRHDLLALENSFEGRELDRRPRDPEKEALLMRLDLLRKADYIRSGKLRIIGPKDFEWRLDFRKGFGG